MCPGVSLNCAWASQDRGRTCPAPSAISAKPSSVLRQPLLADSPHPNFVATCHLTVISNGSNGQSAVAVYRNHFVYRMNLLRGTLARNVSSGPTHLALRRFCVLGFWFESFRYVFSGVVGRLLTRLSRTLCSGFRVSRLVNPALAHPICTPLEWKSCS